MRTLFHRFFFVFFPLLLFSAIFSLQAKKAAIIFMDKQKKILLIGGIVEGAILVFDLIVSIIVWTTISSEAEIMAHGGDYEALNISKNGPFIGFFQNNPTAFFCIICIPLFAMIAADFIYFAILASKKESKLSDAQLEAIKAKAKKEAEEELMREFEKDHSSDNKE